MEEKLSCVINITAPGDYHVKAYAYFDRFDNSKCDIPTELTFSDIPTFSDVDFGIGLGDIGYVACFKDQTYNFTLSSDHFEDINARSSLMITRSNKMYILVEKITKSTRFWIHFEATQEKHRKFFDINPNITVGTLFTDFWFLENKFYPIYTNHVYNFNPQVLHSYMISFQYVMTYFDCKRDGGLWLYNIKRRGSKKIASPYWRRCGTENVHTELYSAEFEIRLISWLDMKPRMKNRFSARGFKLLYSLHADNRSIVQKAPGVFDCSRHYSHFRRHLDCNVRAECLGGEDEPDSCPYVHKQCGGNALFVNVQ